MLTLAPERYTAGCCMVAEEKPTTFIESINPVKIQSLLANITQTSKTTDSFSKEKENALCNKYSEIFNEIS